MLNSHQTLTTLFLALLTQIPQNKTFFQKIELRDFIRGQPTFGQKIKKLLRDVLDENFGKTDIQTNWQKEKHIESTWQDLHFLGPII